MKSMTAFARTQTSCKWGQFSWEIRSVNQRYLDLHFKLPEAYRHLETPIREQLKQSLARGKVEVSLSVEHTQATQAFHINQAILQPLVQAVNEVQQSLIEATHVNPLQILQWPGVMQTESNQSESEQVENELLEGLQQTIFDLNAHREREGDALAEMIKQRCLEIQALTEQAQTLLPEIIERQTQKLQERVLSIIKEMDDNRFHQEVALLAQRLDVQEELDRLQTHLIEVNHVLAESGPVGRRLDFLMQELNREANTLGSKSADSRTSKIGVELKVLIEQMREQVQNIE